MIRLAEVMVCGLAMFTLSACVPWTVRPIGDESQPQSSATVNPAAYVDRIWTSKLLPAIFDSAVDARILLDAFAASPSAATEKFGHHEPNGPTYFLLKGQGRVLAVDTRSRNGQLLVDVAPLDRRADIAIQIGPVLRGTALRDSTGLVRFTDFVNQLQFADVSSELNERVLKTVLASLTPSALEGHSISFAGPASVEQGGQPPVRDLVPVKLTVEEVR